MDTRYHPLTEAVKVAIAKLTSEKAQQFYAAKAQQDVKALADALLIVMQVAYLTCRCIYDLSYIAGKWHHAAITAIVLANKPKPLALSGNAPVALLPATTEKPSRIGPKRKPLVTKPSAETLDSLTVRQLRGLIQRAGLKAPSGARKAELRAMVA